MKERTCNITLLPSGIVLTAFSGDSLYTLLLVAGLIQADQPLTDRLRLEKGSVSPAANPQAEKDVFSQAELTEGWILASERRIMGDATFSLYAVAKGKKELAAQPLAHGYGMAFDLGEGTIAAGLVNLDTMRIPLLSACRNSQMHFGSDHQERMAYCKQDPSKEEQMTAAIRGDIDSLCRKLTQRAGIQSSEIQAITVVGSCALQRLLLGESPLDCAPFPQAARVSGASLGLYHAAEAEVYLLPTVSREIGADTVAAVMACDLFRRKEDDNVSLLIDFGMNTEIVAVGKGRILACTVSTSAMEGREMSCGMPAVTGAITNVQIDEDVTLRTVRDGRPIGIAGVGWIAVVNAMVEQGMIDEEGKLLQPEDLPENITRRFRGTAAGREFVLSYGDANFPKDLSINQEDVLHVQMDKAAIRAACWALLAQMEVSEEELVGVLLAEPYRANIPKEAAMKLGMLPDVDPALVLPIGNASWQGAYLALSDQTFLQDAAKVAASMEHWELQADMVYAEKFIQEMSFR